MIMQYIIDFFNFIGVSLREESPPIMRFACGVFCLALICLLCFINILIYITVIYISEHDYLLSKVSNRPLLLKFINYYKNIRFLYLFLEVSLFLWCLLGIIRLC